MKHRCILTLFLCFSASVFAFVGNGILGELDLRSDLLQLFFCISQTWEGADLPVCAVNCCAWKIGGGGGKVKGTDALSCLQEQKKARLTSKKSGRPCQCVTWGLSVNEAHKGRVMAGSIWSMCLAELPGLSCLTFLVSPSYPWSTFVLDQTLAEKTVGSSSRETDAGVFPSRILCLGVPLVHPYHTGPQPLNQAVPCHRPSAVG